jgi:hypothetical protein
MRMLWITVVILGFITAGTTSSLAQVHEDQAPLPTQTISLASHAIQAPEIPTPDSARRQEELELEKWIHDFSEWKKWIDQWGNRREPGWLSESRQRRQRPDPPEWLFDRCDDSLDDEGRMADACTLVAEWSAGYPTSPAISARVTASPPDEKVEKTVWWEHLHLDVAWPAMQSGASLYGVVGMHATTSVAGRLEIFIAPGAMLLNVPARNGGRAWKLATNYGIAYRLVQFSLLGRQALLHVNLAKAWLFDAGTDVQTKSTDFVGFSMTFKKTR